jgi:hypothetical protein
VSGQGDLRSGRAESRQPGVDEVGLDGPERLEVEAELLDRAAALPSKNTSVVASSASKSADFGRPQVGGDAALVLIDAQERGLWPFVWG